MRGGFLEKTDGTNLQWVLVYSQLAMKNNAQAQLNSTMQQGVMLLQKGNLPAAATLFQQILNAYPRHADALHLLGLVQGRSGELKQAVKSIKRALKINPKAAHYYRNLGLFLMESKQQQEAIVAFKEAIALNPKDADSHNDLGVTFSSQNRVEEAIAEYKKAIRKDPENIRAYNNLGNDLLKKDKLSEAEACQRKVLEINPRDPDAYLNLGIVLRLQACTEESIDVLQQAITFNSKHKEAYLQLGISLTQLDRLDDAVDALNLAMALDPSCRETCRSLGVVLEKQGRIDDAFKMYRRALEIDPQFVEAYLTLGMSLSRLGKFQESNECYCQAIKINPLEARAYKQLVRSKRSAEYEDKLRNMERFYRQKDTPNEQKVTFAFALGMVFEEQNNYEKAFRYLREGNDLKRSTYEYKIEEHQDYFDRLKEVFTTEFFNQRADVGSPDESPIFILGMPRSGTTLVEQMLASHSEIFGAGELTYLSDIGKRMGGKDKDLKFPECMLELEQKEFAHWGSEYVRKIRSKSDSAPYITDKMPHNLLRIGLIKLILPNAKIIHCVRDPMDTCLSIYKTDFNALHKFAYELTELGQYYKLYLDLMAHWRRVLPGFVFDVQYEDLVAQQEVQTRRLLEYCGLPWEDACLAFHQTKRTVATASLAQVRQPIYSDSVRLWESYGKRLAPLEKALS